MYSQDDIKSVFEFVKHTPDKSLRQMLVNKGFTEVHLNVLVKMARTQKQDDFISCFESEKMPTMKYSPAEMNIRENFWPICKTALSGVGLLGQVKKAA